MTTRAHGIGLLSGGLDSALAAKVVQDAGADVTCLHFFTGFCVTGHNSRIGRQDRPINNHALSVAAEAGIPVELVDISQEYLPMVLSPRHGYGANMNPCVDCRVFMLARARRYMEETGADFVFTGEVVGQRPMSQMRRTLALTEQEAGLEGRLLRPLSAKLLDPTIVEQEGRIDREKLHRFHGRSRRPQLELARSYGLSEFAQPAGGCCFLTDENYSRRLKDLIETGGQESLTMDDVYLLGVGRHFRLREDLKFIVGRDEIENNFLDYYTRSHWSAQALDFPSPTVVVVGDLDNGQFERIASVVARYCDGKREASVRVEFRRGEDVRVVDAGPAADDVVERLRI